jgi:hypothetical protein
MMKKRPWNHLPDSALDAAILCTCAIFLWGLIQAILA